jgi:hypothetical protein
MPKTIMHDNGKQFTPKIFKHFIDKNQINEDKAIPNSYPPQLQGKVEEAYNKIVKNEFISVEDISSRDKGNLRYDDMFIKVYNDKREHGGKNGLTPFEMFLQTINRSHNGNNTKQKSVTYLCKCYNWE